MLVSNTILLPEGKSLERGEFYNRLHMCGINEKWFGRTFKELDLSHKELIITGLVIVLIRVMTTFFVGILATNLNTFILGAYVDYR